MTKVSQNIDKISKKKSKLKKNYKKPSIYKFGSVNELTKGVGGSNTDMGQENDTKLGGG